MIFLYDLSITQIGFLLGGSFVAGILNAVSGGGGMVLIPLMVLVGIPPINAIAINKFQNMVGMVAAISHYNTRQDLKWDELFPFLLLAGSGAFIGVIVLKEISETNSLIKILPYILIFIGIYSILPKKTLFFVSSNPKNKSNLPIWVLIGIYGGSISLGTGPLMIALDRYFYSSELRDAITRTKPVLCVITLVSLVALAAMGFLFWSVAITLSVGNFIGAKFGARIVTDNFVKVANVLVFTIPIVTAIRLLLNEGS